MNPFVLSIIFPLLLLIGLPLLLAAPSHFRRKRYELERKTSYDSIQDSEFTSAKKIIGINHTKPHLSTFLLIDSKGQLLFFP